MDYLFDFVLFTIIYFLFFYQKWREKSKGKFIVNTLMYIYIVLVVFVTLMPFSLPTGITSDLLSEHANLLPFRDLLFSYRGATREIILNIIMMTPFGFLYPIVKRKGMLRTVASTFLFSVTIESAQLLSAWLDGLHSRSFDVTDLITNTFGGFVGYLIFIVGKPVIDKLLKV